MPSQWHRCEHRILVLCRYGAEFGLGLHDHRNAPCDSKVRAIPTDERTIASNHASLPAGPFGLRARRRQQRLMERPIFHFVGFFPMPPGVPTSHGPPRPSPASRPVRAIPDRRRQQEIRGQRTMRANQTELPCGFPAFNKRSTRLIPLFRPQQRARPSRLHSHSTVIYVPHGLPAPPQNPRGALATHNIRTTGPRRRRECHAAVLWCDGPASRYCHVIRTHTSSSKKH